VAQSAAPVVTERVLTVPNVISIVRLLCLPVFLWLLFGVDSELAAAVLLGVLGVTDWVDGYIARRFGQVSELGKVLDPTADRLLFFVGITAIVIAGAAPFWFSILALAREVLVGLSLVVLSLFGMKRFDVAWSGKAGTLCLMISFPSFLLAAGTTGFWHAFGLVFGWGWGLPGLAFSYYSAFTYVPMMRNALREGREARV
jgi:cardiolipin synthase (CMP-forming)